MLTSLGPGGAVALPAAEAETGDAAGDGAAAGAVAGGARTRRRHRRRPLGQTGRYTLQRRRNGLGIRRCLRLPSSLVNKRRLRMCTHQQRILIRRLAFGQKPKIERYPQLDFR